VKVETLNTHGGMYSKPAGCSTPAYGAPHKQTKQKTSYSYLSSKTYIISQYPSTVTEAFYPKPHTGEPPSTGHLFLLL
jgi:hypothetical protein